MTDAGSRILTGEDVYLFREGRHVRLYDKFGAHLAHEHDTAGTRFTVWAPNARAVSVIGDFNGWNRHAHAMHPRPDGSGIWETFVPGVGHGTLYKYYILSQRDGVELDKADPFAFAAE
jgi:1,4-alpha-glucan branching enzyme